MGFEEKIIRNIIAPIWAAKEGSPYLKHLEGLGRSKFRPLEQVREDLRNRLAKLLAHAYAHSDFYQQRMDEAGIRPRDNISLDDLCKLQLLTKDDIRNNKDSMIAGNFLQEKLIKKSTSGSTGIPLNFYVDEESSQWKRAVTISYDRWTGWDLGERAGVIWGNPEYKENWRSYLRNALLSRQICLDALKITEESMLQFYNTLKRKCPPLLYGHAHSLFLFAKFLEHKGLQGIRFRGIISTAMVLHDFERATIEKIFACKVTNRYGCEEVSLIACECGAHNGLHLNCDSLIVEFIRDGIPVKPGEPGAIVVTDLTNYGMPLIRYKIGDVGIPSVRSCPCGCTYPLMDSLEGRVADYIVTPDGKFISGISLTDNFFSLNLPGIKQMQIIQERINHLVFRIVKSNSFSERTLQDLANLTKEYFGDKMEYQIEYCDSIQSESSGKYRFCISKIPNPFS